MRPEIYNKKETFKNKVHRLWKKPKEDYIEQSWNQID